MSVLLAILQEQSIIDEMVNTGGMILPATSSRLDYAPLSANKAHLKQKLSAPCQRTTIPDLPPPPLIQDRRLVCLQCLLRSLSIHSFDF
jgi:hypothetical protein